VQRREFIALLGTAGLWPPIALAQQPSRTRRIGLLMGWADGDLSSQAYAAAFHQEIARLGWKEGNDLQVDERWVADDMDRIRAYAADLATLQPEVIVLTAARMVPVLRVATTSVPIVFTAVSDPLGAGFVASLARPGGNVTGFSLIEYSIVGKLLEALKQVAPKVTRVAHMFNPDNPNSGAYFRAFQAAALPLGVTAVATPFHTPAEIKQVITSFASEPNGGLLLSPDATSLRYRELIFALALENNLPSVSTDRSYVSKGCLVSYGPVLVDLFRRAAGYVDRVLRGEKPSDLPVQQPTAFELLINLNTAKALGLTIPETLLATADEVIQ
jgi:putative tryptophan/tyrosine transport system substrate-binding protein